MRNELENAKYLRKTECDETKEVNGKDARAELKIEERCWTLSAKYVGDTQNRNECCRTQFFMDTTIPKECQH